jgi:hypothetical protein
MMNNGIYKQAGFAPDGTSMFKPLNPRHLYYTDIDAAYKKVVRNQSRLTVGFINIVRYCVKQATDECRSPCTMLRNRQI